MTSPISSPQHKTIAQEINRFVKKRELAKITGLSGDTLKRYRGQGLLCEDIHWIRVNSKVVLYNLPLVLDWLQNIHDPATHQKAIEAYLTALPSHQKKRRSHQIS
jgi:hypothetical protein